MNEITDFRKKTPRGSGAKIFVFIVIAIVILFAGAFLFRSNISNNNQNPPGNPPLPQEPISKGFQYKDLVVVEAPIVNQKITNPLVVKGKARGTWFFEASFPVHLLDENGTVLVSAPAQAESDWMTSEYVPFSATLYFTEPTTSIGSLVLQKDNPSGLPESDDSFVIPVSFDTSSGNPVGALCKPTGCSSQICSDKEVVSTCEYKEEYACYRTAICKRQNNGQCGWVQTSKLAECLLSKKTNQDSSVPQ